MKTKKEELENKTLEVLKPEELMQILGGGEFKDDEIV